MTVAATAARRRRDGNDMDTYAADVAQLARTSIWERRPRRPFHGRRRSRPLRRSRTAGPCAKAVLIGAVPPIMVKTEKNPGGLPIEVFDGFRAALAGESRAVLPRHAGRPLLRLQSAGRKVSQGVIDNWWRQGMMGGAKAHYDCIKAFSETDFTEDLKAITVPVLILHGDDDQIVPIADSALLPPSWSEEGHV